MVEPKPDEPPKPLPVFAAPKPPVVAGLFPPKRLPPVFAAAPKPPVPVLALLPKPPKPPVVPVLPPKVVDVEVPPKPPVVLPPKPVLAVLVPNPKEISYQPCFHILQHNSLQSVRTRAEYDRWDQVRIIPPVAGCAAAPNPPLVLEAPPNSEPPVLPPKPVDPKPRIRRKNRVRQDIPQTSPG